MVEKLVMSNVSPGTEFATRARNVPGPESAKLVTTNVPGVRNIWSSPFTDPPPFVATARKWYVVPEPRPLRSWLELTAPAEPTNCVEVRFP